MPVLAERKPIWCRTWAAWVSTSKPPTVAVPAVGRSTVLKIRKAVVLPAPLGPKSP